MKFRYCEMYLESILVVTTVASLICVSHSYPFPGGTNHVVHSLATYATTNSFVYSPANNLGRISYRFSKPSLTPLQMYAKFIGLSHPQSFASSTGPIFTSAGGASLNNIVSFEKDVATGEIKLTSSDLSTYLTPPEPDSTFATFLKSNAYISNNNLAKSNDFEGDKLQVPLTASGNDVISDTDFSHPPEVDSSADPVQTISDSSSKSQVATAVEETDNFSSKGSPFDTPSNEDTSLQNRQDSNFEQPLPFFSPVPQNVSPQSGTPRPQFPITGTGNFGLTGPSTLQQQGFPAFPSINRFAVNRNVVPQSAFQPTQTQSPSISPVPQPQGHIPSFPSGNGGFPSPYSPETPKQSQPPVPPPHPQFQFPRYNPGNGGPPPPQQEPENGFNPFHMHENYPEPPYESEFANEPSRDDEFVEQRQHPSNRNNGNTQPPAPLDFAQSTLRNVRTEELLDVVERKPVPPDCVYNTISYGANGEDCVSKKK